MDYQDTMDPGPKDVRPARDYQAKCIQDALAALETHKSALVVMPTGTGKTLVFSKIAEQWSRGNTLVLAHRIELVDQAAQSIAKELGYTPVIEQGNRGCDPEFLHQGGVIVVGSIQSMITKRRMDKFRRVPFGLLIIDECHRATSSGYRRLIAYYRELDPELRVLGVTATPNRTDGTALGIVFDHVAFEMNILDGIDNGWLVDIHQKFGVLGEVDFSKLRTTKNQFGEVDFNPDDLEKVMTEEKSLHEMSKPVLDTTEDGRQAIIFTASVAHAHLWAMVLNRYRPGCAVAVDGTTDKEERKRAIYMFREGKIQFLLNYNLFTEGFDAPNTAMIVMGRPTKSLLVYCQMLGRGTRVLPGVVDGVPTVEGRKDAIAASSKPFVTVLDFVGNSRHKIISATDVLGGNYDVDVKETANRRLGKNAGNVREEMKKARAAMILAAEERKRMGMVFEDVEYSLQEVSPFDASLVGVVSKPQEGRGTITDNQLGFLIKLGIPYKTAVKYSRGQAGAVLSAKKQKSCTAPQAKVLRKFGYNPENFNVETASKQIDAIKSNGWRRPD